MPSAARLRAAVRNQPQHVLGGTDDDRDHQKRERDAPAKAEKWPIGTTTIS